MPKPLLRRALAEDQQLVLHFLSDFYSESSFELDKAKAARAIESLIATPHYGILFVIDVEGRPAGYTALTFGFSLEFNGLDGIIDDLYLAPSFRDKGIGRQVVELVLQAAREEGLNAVHLEVEHSNKRAQKVYFQAGFKDYERHLLTCRL